MKRSARNSARSLKAAFRVTALLLILAIPTAAREEADPPPGLGVHEAETDGLHVVETVLPGEPIAASAWPSGGLAVLVIEAPEPEADGVDVTPADERPRALYRVRGRATDLEPILRGLPAEIEAVDVAGDDLWLGGDGTLYRVDDRVESGPGVGGASLESVIEQPGANLVAMARGGLLEGEGLRVPDVGVLRHFDRAGVLLDETPLPTAAERRRRRLILRSPNVTRLADGTLIAGPDPAGSTRVRHLIINGEEEAVEAWTRFGRPEDIEQHWYLLKDGEPVFLAATTEADRLGVFEKLELRIFHLQADRTRAGRAALFETDSETIHWHRFEPLFLDWDGDGRQDLLLVQPDGMSPDDLVVELFRARAGRFDPRPKRTKLDAESATWHLGEDFDGDGLPDLVVGTGTLSIYRGVEHRRRVVDKDPWRELRRDALRRSKRAVHTVEEATPTTDDRPSFRGKIRVFDVDGDGESEIVVVRHHEGRSVVRLIDVLP